MKLIWFKRYLWFYIPVHILGVIVTIAALAFLVPIFTAIVRNGTSVTDDLYHMFVYTSCTFFWWKWIADTTSNEEVEVEVEND